MASQLFFSDSLVNCSFVTALGVKKGRTPREGEFVCVYSYMLVCINMSACMLINSCLNLCLQLSQKYKTITILLLQSKEDKVSYSYVETAPVCSLWWLFTHSTLSSNATWCCSFHSQKLHMRTAVSTFGTNEVKEKSENKKRQNHIHTFVLF